MNKQDVNTLLCTYDRLAFQIFIDLTSIPMEWTMTQFGDLLSVGFVDELKVSKNMEWTLRK
jgi:hypothetical protein